MEKREIDRIRSFTQDATEQNFITLGYLIHDVARQLKRSFEENARRHGITLPQWRLIRQLQASGELSQTSLAGLVDSDPMTVSRMVERMEAGGLVERRADPNDSRAKLVRLTPSAKALIEKMRRVGVNVFENALEGVSDAERATLLKALNRISDNLDAESASVKEEV
jgi:DNA-binding MarR family transcriptional regulator